METEIWGEVKGAGGSQIGAENQTFYIIFVCPFCFPQG